MLNEPVKIMLRRFIDRLTESGLLVLTVALGVGAFAAGGALFINVQQQSAAMLASPEYHEIVISTRTNTEDMATPVEAKALNEDTILTQSDLSAGDMIPAVEYSYIMNHSRLRLINEDSIARETAMREEFQAQAEAEGGTPPEGETTPEGADAAPEGDGGFFSFSQDVSEDWDEIAADSDILIADVEEVSGYEVTSGFFPAWGIDAAAGSLFSQSDYDGTDDVILLGSTIAETLADGDDTTSLIGKKLLTREGYQTIIGILETTGTTVDKYYVEPYKDVAASGGFTGFRMMFMNSELRFSVSDPEALDSTAQMLDEWFTSQFGEDQINVLNPRIEAEQTIARNNGISLLLLILAVAGLFIASVNIAHMLLSRTMRMKKHVGILMALGATRKNVNRLFATEALLVIVLGTVVGALIAIPLNLQMKASLELMGNSTWMVALSALLSAVIIFIFTQMPIRRFDSIKPADAMRAQ